MVIMLYSFCFTGSTLTFGVPLTQLSTSSEDLRELSSPTDTQQPVIQLNISLIVKKIVEHIEEHGKIT